MRLVNANYNIDINLNENSTTVISIENPELFTNFVFDLKTQCESGSGNFVLSSDNKELRLDKCSDFILNPFDLDVNGKRFYTKFLKELQELSRENDYEDFIELNSSTLQYIEKVVDSLPYVITYNTEITETDLYKLYNVKIEDDCGTLAEKIANYVKISQQLLNTKIIFFVNLKDYISVNDLIEVYKEFYYNKIHLIIIEARKNDSIEGEYSVIIDKDNCIIQY
jgi:CRISPR type II-A-associated protein Csn2